MFCGSCVASWSLHAKSKNNASQSRSSLRQQPYYGGAVQPDMEPFLSISHRPSAPCGAADRGRNLGCCRPFLRSGKDCTGADRVQDFTYCRHEAVLYHASAIQNSNCYRAVRLLYLQPRRPNKSVKHRFDGDD